MTELFVQHYLIIYHKNYSHNRVPAPSVDMATSALSQTKACVNSAHLPIMHVPPLSICERPNLIWFLLMSGHLITRPKSSRLQNLGLSSRKRTRDINELTQRLVDVWSDCGQKIIDGAIDEWRKRLQACIHMKGHHFEHVL